jgi:hypothetical protein
MDKQVGNIKIKVDDGDSVVVQVCCEGNILFLLPEDMDDLEYAVKALKKAVTEKLEKFNR